MKTQKLDELEDILDYHDIADMVLKTNCEVVRIYYDLEENKLVTGCYVSTNDDITPEEKGRLVLLYTWTAQDEDWVSDDDLIEDDDDKFYAKYRKEVDVDLSEESFKSWLKLSDEHEYMRRVKTYMVENMYDEDLQAQWIDEILKRGRNQ